MSDIDSKSDIKKAKDNAQYGGLNNGDDFSSAGSVNWVDGGKDWPSDNGKKKANPSPSSKEMIKKGISK